MTASVSQRYAILAMEAPPEQAQILELRAAQLAWCAAGIRRCDLNACPKCSVNKSKRLTGDVEAMIVPGVSYAFVTLTVGADSLRTGYRLLSEAFRRLRRRAVWRPFVGGAFQCSPVPAKGSQRPWNIHGHGVIEFGSEAIVDMEHLEGSLQNEWPEILALVQTNSSLTGSAHVRRFPIADQPTDGHSRYAFESPVTRDVLTFGDENLRAFVTETRGLRLVATFGTWRKRGIGKRHRTKRS